MKRRHVATGAVALTTAIAMAGAGATMAHAAGNGSDKVRLTNSGPTALPNHSGLRTLGVASSSQSLQLSIAVPLRNEALLDSMLAKGTVISPAQYERLFGASPASLKKVADWAKDNGLKVTSRDASNGLVNVSAPVRTVNKAFSLKMERVALGAHTGLAPNSAPQLPKALGVTSVSGLSTVTTRHTGPVAKNLKKTKVAFDAPKRNTMNSSSRSPFAKSGQGSLGGKTTAATATNGYCSTYWGENLAVTAKKFPSMSNPMCGYSPQQAVKLYNASKGQTAKSNVGVLLWCDDKSALTKANQISDHFKYPRLASYHNESVAENPQYCDGDPLGVYAEQNMDIQTSHYMAPQASVYYYGASAPTDSALLTMFSKAVNDHKVSTLSMSWGGDEAPASSSFQTQFNRIAAKASVTGISLFASSGDMGDGSIEENGTGPSRAKTPSFPATSPFVTAVGGTVAPLAQDGSRAFTGGWSNTLWDQPNPASTSGITQFPFFGNSVGAGGGVSKAYNQPAWQKGVVTGSTTKRTFPDVSAIADPASGLGLNFDGSGIYAGGGTSQSSPLVAALVADSKALTGRKVGNAAPYFYKLKGTSNITDVKPLTAGKYGTVAGQVSSGDYVLEGLEQPADSLRTTAGWDNVTGLGEPSGSFLTSFGK